jgi:hypothetical protein
MVDRCIQLREQAIDMHKKIRKRIPATNDRLSRNCSCTSLLRIYIPEYPHQIAKRLMSDAMYIISKSGICKSVNIQ